MGLLEHETDLAMFAALAVVGVLTVVFIAAAARRRESASHYGSHTHSASGRDNFSGDRIAPRMIADVRPARVAPADGWTDSPPAPPEFRNPTDDASAPLAADAAPDERRVVLPFARANPKDPPRPDAALADTPADTGPMQTAVERILRLAAEQGDTEARYRLGVLFLTGDSVGQNDAEAAHWFRLAAEDGHPDAQYDLGVMYATGRGMPRDESEAVAWFRRAAEQNNADARYNLSIMAASAP